MSCPVLQQLSDWVASTAALPKPSGLGAGDILAEQVRGIAAAVAVLERELALRMAALESEDPRSDPRGQATTAGAGSTHTAQLRGLGRFTHTHPALQSAWVGGMISTDQVRAVQSGSHSLPPAQQAELVRLVGPLLPGLDIRSTRQLVVALADQLQPGDPDLVELSEHKARHLIWSTGPRGGLSFQGYLPAAEADQLRAAITAITEELRAQGDGITPRQRRADALTALVERAQTNHPARGGGLPAALTLTVSLTEAERIAARDPRTCGTGFQARPYGDGRIHNHPAGDTAIRFGLCCASITPLLHTNTRSSTGPGGSTADVGAAAAGSLLDRVARTTVEPVAVGRAVRLATPAQRKALQTRDGGCVIPGCDIPAGYTQPHHVTGWSLGGKTDLDNLVSVCFVHHRQTELGRWTFTPKQPGEPTPEGAHEHHHWWITPPTH